MATKTATRITPEVELQNIVTPSGATAEVSSGNVFADLGLPHPEQALLRSKLAIEIRHIIEAKGLTQAEAAKIVGVSQPKISEITRGRVADYSVERLLRMINKLGYDVELQVSPRKRADAVGTLRVKAA